MNRRLLLVGTALLALLAPAAPAAADGTRAPAVTISASQVVISGPGTIVIVRRNPFWLEILTDAGAPALAEVANRQPGAATLTPTSDPIAPGTDAQRSGQLYAPLAFLVGQQSIAQYPGSVWGGNLMSGSRAGIQYAARRVIAARTAGSGAVLTVSTNDPSGRTLRVQIAPAGAGLVRVSVTPHPAAGVALMGDAFTSTRAEAFHGFGGRHNAVDQHGQAISSFVEKENVPGLGTPGTPSGILYPNGPAATFYPQAQFISSRGYGFLLDQPELAWFRLDSDRPDAWSVAAAAPSLTYVVAPGAPAHAIGALTALTGRQSAPAAWALGPMLDRLVRNGGETQADYEASLASDISHIDSTHLPLTGYRIEGWRMRNPDNDGLVLYNPPVLSFATQSQIVAELRARHIHPLAYLRPFIAPGSAPDREGLTIRLADGTTATTTGTLGQHIAELDFTNPAAVRFWRREIFKMLDLGFDGFLADFGEEVLYDWRFHDGSTGVTMHNRNPILYMRATREAVTAYEHAHPGRQMFFYYAGGYSGTPGSAAYEGANLPGDEATNWTQASGLQSLAPDMLSRAIGGAFGFTTDIGGYYDITTPPTTKELFLRWAEWAALSPIFRLHGSGRAGTHTPWTYDAETVHTYRALSLLHERAAPLILRLWRDADRTGIPPTRPLWLQFPGDPRAAAQQQEWTLGDDVLVAPVVSEGAVGRSVYFPAGCWR
ncbi:MAG TPA: TIM-barrel domain-containing protein, partial [Solirubrobacteraceae bacterium]|nr:TIM-barrel domain-containing protein [Solirubrobacteraceae bacterium]